MEVMLLIVGVRKDAGVGNSNIRVHSSLTGKRKPWTTCQWSENYNVLASSYNAKLHKEL
mgnify:CR=1 FL=1